MDVMALRRSILAGNSFTLAEYTATGNPLSFETNIVKTLKSLVIPWTPTQSGTGDPSPENVRPISGMDGVRVWHFGKNIANVVGYSAEGVADGLPGSTTNTYGTTINTTSPSNAVVVTQSSSTTDYAKSSYRNGFVIIRLDPIIKFNKTYDFSFKITNIVSNPLDATLSEIQVLAPNGANLTKNDFEIKGDTLIFRNALYTPHSNGNRTTVEIRICGMSCTISDFMITAPNTSDGEYAPYTGQSYPVTFPALGRNLFYRTGEVSNSFINENGDIEKDEGWIVSDYIPVKPNTQYTFTPNTTAGRRARHAYYTDGKVLISVFGSGQQTFTTPANCYFMQFSYRVTSSNIMLNTGSTAESYEPYTNTVYGGSLDVTTGVLTAEWKYDDMGNYSWENASSANSSYVVLSWSNGYNGDNQPYLFADSFNVVSVNTFNSKVGADGYWATMNSSKRFYIMSTALNGMTATEVKEFVTGMKFCVKLLEPITYQLTPQEITSLIGTNVLWSDTNGSNTAVYLKK